ncbi:mannose-1-phosphate guanylyltransferase [Oceanirhabdus seepicola]|uniref:Mannose-1-phosphate guanylyltransferase n=1 Tax=Oceanirhabdus seepicola TaxID=2828781 RepID=A0A9J6P390_9CLOT|nr:mannose-1-phosphate guanylyltransferase [Oceanirhabdus seepicola]MCM1990521.1 mannose-1-phosphate guanylyltransferase [Oceanirhabdus seepicola]
MLTILILAGGKGKRLAPLSTEEKPKQFLKFNNDKSLLQQTFNRAEGIVGKENVFVVTCQDYEDEVRSQLCNINYDNIIFEPHSRNTAPALLLGVMRIREKYEDAAVLVIPSDHIIDDSHKFYEDIKNGQRYLEYNDKAIITFGIKPNRPETAFGYIRYNPHKYNERIYKCEEFVEKPSLERAIEYIDKGNYLWNSGMFLFRGENIIRLSKKFLPDTFKVLTDICMYQDHEYNKILKEKYMLVDKVSIDYGIMEKYDEIYVILSEFKWDDLGSFEALRRNDISMIE